MISKNRLINVKKARGILKILPFLAAAVAVTGAVVFLMVRRLPDPRTASGRGLGQWLVQRDLAGESDTTQRSLVDRLETALNDPGEWAVLRAAPGSAGLSDSQRERLHKNVQLLKRVWFFSRVDALLQSPVADRDAFLDRQLASVAQLSSWDETLGQQAAGGRAPAAADGGLGLVQDLDGWMAETSGQRRQEVEHAVSLGVARWLMTGDLSRESVALRSELARRIALWLDARPPRTEVLSDCSPAEKDCLRTNARLLMEAWFCACANHYAELTGAAERAGYVVGQIERLEQWDITAVVADEPQLSQAAATREIVEMVKEWIDRAPDQQQPALRQFFLAVQQQYFLRMLQRG